MLFKAAINLKGLLIKIGQFMSARVDFLPDEYTDALSRLQDQVPAADFSLIKKRLIEEPRTSRLQSSNPLMKILLPLHPLVRCTRQY